MTPAGWSLLLPISNTATDTSIADYNTEVSTEANTVAALQDLETTWSVIGSTTSENAIDNIGQDAGIPIYNLNGQLVADDATTNTGGLFSDALINGIGYQEDGTLNRQDSCLTGTSPDGTAAIGAELGHTGPAFGACDGTGAGWVRASTGLGLGNLYAISGEISVGASTPEPSTTAMAIMVRAVLCLATRRRAAVRLFP